MSFEDVVVPAKNVLAEVGYGFKLAMKVTSPIFAPLLLYIEYLFKCRPLTSRAPRSPLVPSVWPSVLWYLVIHFYSIAII